MSMSGEFRLTETGEPMGPHPRQWMCSCEGPIAERPHRLSIVEGRVSLTCATCDLHLPYEDWWGEEAVEMEPIPVRLVVHVENEGSDAVYCWLEVTPDGA